MTSSTLYELRDVAKGYGTSFALRIEQLEIQRGEVLGFLGPTGAGKSTLLRLLGGLDRPSSGTLRLEDHCLASSELPLARRRRITMVHQRPLLLRGTVRYNVEYGLRLRKVRDFSSRADAMLERLGIARYAAQSARTLSGGQTQLVALARALVLEPDVLLLDEPTANLDPAHVALAEQTIREVQRQRHVSVVWATHNLFQARRVAGRIGFLLNGQLVEMAATEAFFKAPVDPHGRLCRGPHGLLKHLEMPS